MKRIATAVAAVLLSYSALANPLPSDSGIPPADMSLPAAFDKACQKTLADAKFLRNAMVDFTVSENSIESYPLWPLLCAPTVETERATVERLGPDVLITYVNRDKTMPRLTIRLERIELENDDDAPAYVITRMGDMRAVSYEEQDAVRLWLLDCFEATRRDNFVILN